MKRVLSCCVLAGAIMAGTAEAAPSSVSVEQALIDAVGVCQSIAKSAYTEAPDSTLTTDVATTDARPGKLSGFFFKGATDVKFASRPATSGAVLLGWSRQQTKCAVFVLGASADSGIANLRAELEKTHKSVEFDSAGKAIGYESNGSSQSLTIIHKGYTPDQGSERLSAAVTIRSGQ